MKQKRKSKCSRPDKDKFSTLIAAQNQLFRMLNSKTIPQKDKDRLETYRCATGHYHVGKRY